MWTQILDKMHITNEMEICDFIYEIWTWYNTTGLSMGPRQKKIRALYVPLQSQEGQERPAGDMLKVPQFNSQNSSWGSRGRKNKEKGGNFQEKEEKW